MYYIYCLERVYLSLLHLKWNFIGLFDGVGVSKKWCYWRWQKRWFDAFKIIISGLKLNALTTELYTGVPDQRDSHLFSFFSFWLFYRLFKVCEIGWKWASLILKGNAIRSSRDSPYKRMHCEQTWKISAIFFLFSAKVHNC